MSPRDRTPIIAIVLTALAAGSLTCSQAGTPVSATQTPYVVVVTATVPHAVQTLAAAVSTRRPTPAADVTPPTPTPSGPRVPGYENVEFLPNDVFLRSVNAGANILQSLAIGGMGGGGGGGCDDPDVVHVFPFLIANCSIPPGASVRLDLVLPDGTKAELDTRNTATEPGFYNCLHRGWSAEPGTYTLTLTTGGRTLRGTYSIAQVVSPTVAVSDSDTSIFGCDGEVVAGQPADVFLFGFQPSESVLVVLYYAAPGQIQYVYSTEWRATMDQTGRLLQHIAAARLPNEGSYILAALGREQQTHPNNRGNGLNDLIGTASTGFIGLLHPIPTPTAPPPATATTAPLVAGHLDGLVPIPAGAFTMGSDASDPFSDPSERPPHKVLVSAFWIQQTEVSNAAYAACVAAQGCSPPATNASTTRADYFGNPAYSDYAVVNIRYDQAAAFCAWAGGRLPTEAEWEKAARGPDNRRYPWGNQRPDRGLANYGKIIKDTTPVNGYAGGASPYGLLNMGGNVWEWVADWFDPAYYTASPPTDPKGPSFGQERVLRGGSFSSDGQFLRATNRYYQLPSQASPSVGFRCASQPIL